MSGIESKGEGTGSPSWQRVLDCYRDELEQKDDYEEILEVGSLEALLNRSKTLKSHLPPQWPVLHSMHRLGSTLKMVADFSGMIAFYFGADPKLMALGWGSIWLMLSRASSAGDVLQNVLDMVEDLGLALPRFQAYEKTLPMDTALGTVLLDVYAEQTCFYVRTINFFRIRPHPLSRRNGWGEFRADIDRTVDRIKCMSSAIEREANFSRLRLNEVKTQRILDLLETLTRNQLKVKESLDIRDSLKKSSLLEDEAIQCYHVPFEPNPRFWGREQALQAIEEALNPEERYGFPKAFALYGMGGVGKTQIALEYANRNRYRYNAILWVVAENRNSMAQSFQDIAQILRLVKSEEEIQHAVEAIKKVKNWLSQARCNWLLIFDNVEDLEILRLVWPGNSHGSVLVTTRDFNVAYSPASGGFHVQPFDDILGSNVLLNLVGLSTKLASGQEKALEVTRALGGLPLALNQIGGFILERKLPLQSFLPYYERNSAKIDSRKTGLSTYEHTLSTVWEESLNKLSGHPYVLLNLLVFFKPESIHEFILIEGSKLLYDEEFNFIHDEIELGDAEAVLLRAALIEKSIDDAFLSIHQLVQVAVMRRLTEGDRIKYFDTAVRIFSWGVPAKWSEDIDGQQYEAWRKCKRIFSRHFDHLCKQTNRYKIRSRNTQLYGELILRYSWYYYQGECYSKARNLVGQALETFQDKKSLVFAKATDLSGLIDLDINFPRKALVSFNTAAEIREELLGPDNPFVAASLDNIALAYIEMAELDKARTTQQNAIDIRIRTQSHRAENSYRNMSSLLLRMGEADEAEEMLIQCRSLEEFGEEYLYTSNGFILCSDMVLMSRIRARQGRLDDAMWLASKALTFRRSYFNPRSKICDSLYDVANLLDQQGKAGSAIDLLTELVGISKQYPEGKGQLARANYRLAVLYDREGKGEDSKRCKARAIELRALLRSEEAKEAPFEEVEFMKLCPWMLSWNGGRCALIECK